MSTDNTSPAALPQVAGCALKACPFCGLEVRTHEAGFTHDYNKNCFLFVMTENNGLTTTRGVYLERLYAAWNTRVEIEPTPRVDLAGASPAQVQRVVGQTEQ